MEITGKVTKIFDTQTFQSGFKKREIIVTTEEQYPQPISIEFLQEKTEIPDSLNIGDMVNVSINIRGREWTSPDGVVKYFNSIVGWRVEKVKTESIQPGNPSTTGNAPSPENFSSDKVSDLSGEDDVDDLPF
ncbi:DUF3127 domain-containing protein [Flavobacteriaceae bacterium Ap0902]|nr:DUF3127 domain-containing protein [Flavobacteriaceae bacterium Ap0902]